MTTKELIAILSKLDPNTRVFVKGYEGGYDDAQFFGEEDYILDVSAGMFSGTHARIISKEELKSPDFIGKKIVKGICL